MSPQAQAFEARMRQLHIDRAATITQIQPNYWQEIRTEAQEWKQEFLSQPRVTRLAFNAVNLSNPLDK